MHKKGIGLTNPPFYMASNPLSQTGLDPSSPTWPYSFPILPQKLLTIHFIGSSLFCVGKQLLQAPSTQRINSPGLLDRINMMDRMLPAGRKPDRQ
jgi:hypothetical protein